MASRNPGGTGSTKTVRRVQFVRSAVATSIRVKLSAPPKGCPETPAASASALQVHPDTMASRNPGGTGSTKTVRREWSRKHGTFLSSRNPVKPDLDTGSTATRAPATGVLAAVSVAHAVANATRASRQTRALERMRDPCRAGTRRDCLTRFQPHFFYGNLK